MHGLMLIFVLCASYLKVGESTRPADRITQGVESKIEDRPYQVSYIVNNSYFCGGFIISKDYILTAAHCTQKATPKTIVLRGNSSYRNNGTIISIAEVYTHPQYGDPPFDKDVGILKTVDPIKFTDKMKPVKLPAKGSMLKDGSEVTVSGWGKTKYEVNKIPERLMEVTIPVIANWKCRLVYSTVLTENMWCGGNFLFGGQGSCQGDSGGPAVQDGVVYGIVSFGRGCGYALSPSVFTSIPAEPIWDFIANVTGMSF